MCLVVIGYDQPVHGKDHPEEEQGECDLLQHCSNYDLLLTTDKFMCKDSLFITSKICLAAEYISKISLCVNKDYFNITAKRVRV